MRTGKFQGISKTRTLRGLAREEWAKLVTLWWFFLGPVLPIALLALPRIARDRRMKLLLITAIVTLAGLAVEAWHQPHYFAPLTCVIYAIVIQGLRHLRQWRRASRNLGRALVPIIGIACFAVCLFQHPRRISRSAAKSRYLSLALATCRNPGAPAACRRPASRHCSLQFPPRSDSRVGLQPG